MKYLASKCCCGERSLYRYIGALVRNGYVIKESGKEKGQPSRYWLCLDRAASADITEFQWTGDDVDPPQDVEEGSANLAEGDAVENAAGVEPIWQTGSATVGRARESESHQNIIESEHVETEPLGFSRRAQDLERESFAVASLARQANAQHFVIENSRAWDAWLDYRKSKGLPRSLPTCWGEVNGQTRRGWYMPSLFPPNETGPPAQAPPPSAADQDHPQNL